VIATVEESTVRNFVDTVVMLLDKDTKVEDAAEKSATDGAISFTQGADAKEKDSITVPLQADAKDEAALDFSLA